MGFYKADELTEVQENEGGYSPRPEGVYPFVVKDIKQKDYTSKDGNAGSLINITLEVNDNGNTFKSFGTIFLKGKGLRYLKTFMDSLGVDFYSEPELIQLVGLGGKAKFKYGEEKDNGNKYLEPVNWIDNGEEKIEAPSVAASAGEDDPF